MSTRTRAVQLTERFLRAVEFAATRHAAKPRKTGGGGVGTPYLGHLLAVAALVIEHHGDEDQCIAALLHDTAEDTGGRPVLAEIRAAFGTRVEQIVEACSDSLTAPGERKMEWRTRKEAHIARLAHASEDVRLVYSADKVHNLHDTNRGLRRCGGDVARMRAYLTPFTGGPAGSEWYYEQVLHAIARAGGSPLHDEFEREVAEFKRHIHKLLRG